jgi:RNA-directed DNA polymerase
MALEQARKYVAQEGREIVVDLDLEKFFDRVNHDILMSRVARRMWNPVDVNKRSGK